MKTNSSYLLKGMIVLLCVVMSGVWGCDNEEKKDSDFGPNIGLAMLYLKVPADTLCIEITVKNEGRTEIRKVDVVPGSDISIPLDGLPLGQDVFTGAAHGVACDDVDNETVPVWLTKEPVITTVAIDPRVNVVLAFVRNGRIVLEGTFEEDIANAVPALEASVYMPAGVQLVDMVVDPETGYLYVLGAETSTIYVLNSDLETVDTITTNGTTPISLDIDPSPGNKRLFVSLNSPSSVEIYTLEPTIALSCVTAISDFGIYPTIAYNPINDRIYAGASNGLRVVDSECSAGPLVDVGYGSLSDVSVDTLSNKVYISLHHAWKLLIVDGADADLDPSDSFTLEDLVVQGDPLSVAVDSYSHQVYVGMNVGSAIERVDANPQTGLPPFTHEALVVGNAPARLKVNPVLNRVYISIRDFLQVATVTGGEVTQIVETDQIGMIPRFIAVDTASHCLYVANHPANTENKILKLCEPAKKQLGIAALKRMIKRCVPYVANQEILLEDVEQVINTSGEISAINSFIEHVDNIAPSCREEIGGLSGNVWSML